MAVEPVLPMLLDHALCLSEWKCIMAILPYKSICKECGKEFPSKREGQLFCSRTCSNPHLGNRRQQTWHKYICLCCGKKFESKSLYRKYCSRLCQGKMQSKLRRCPDRELVKARNKAAKLATRMVCRTLRYTEKNKKAKSKEILGYTGEDLRKHLEALWELGMSWDNHGWSGWHVDHIRPVSDFPKDTPLSVINALDNLRPLWAKDNYSKGRKVG